MPRHEFREGACARAPTPTYPPPCTQERGSTRSFEASLAHLLRKQVGHDHLRKGHVGHRDVQAVHVHLCIGLLQASEHGDRHDEAIAEKLPAEQVGDDAQHAEARRERARILAKTEHTLEPLAKLHQIVHLLQQLWADPTKEGC